MTTQDLNFTVETPITGDTGERTDSASIKPIVPGDPARAISVNRPLQNLRNRTEILRQTVEDLLHKTDSQSWFIAGGNAAGEGAATPKVTWNHTTGIFVVDSPLVLQNLVSPAESQQETHSYNFGSPVTGTVAIGTDVLRAYGGANRLKLIWENATAASLATAAVPNKCDIVVSGSPVHIITIRLVDTGKAIISDLIDAVDSRAVELAAAGCSIVPAGDYNTYLTWDEIPDPIYPVDSLFKVYTFSKTYERELHYITATVFSDFFATSANCLLDGDTLAIAFATYEDRRTSFSGTGGVSTVVVGDLFNARLNPEKLANCIPLCKRVGDVLYWIDGTVCASGTQVSFRENSITVDRTADSAIHIAEVAHTPKHQPYYMDDVISPAGGVTLHEAFVNTLIALQGKKPIDNDATSSVPRILSTVDMGGTAMVVREFANSSGVWRVIGGHPDPTNSNGAVLPDIEGCTVFVEGYILGAYITAFKLAAVLGVSLRMQVAGDWTQYDVLAVNTRITTLGAGHQTLNADLELGNGNKLYRTAITPAATATPLIKDVEPGGSGLPAHVCVYESGPLTADAYKLRMYVSNNIGVSFTKNAYFDEIASPTPCWKPDHVGVAASRVCLGGSIVAFGVDVIPDAPSSWLTTAWSTFSGLSLLPPGGNQRDAAPEVIGYGVRDTVRVYCSFEATVPGDTSRIIPITWHSIMSDFAAGLLLTVVNKENSPVNVDQTFLAYIDEYGALLCVVATQTGTCTLHANIQVCMPTP